MSDPSLLGPSKTKILHLLRSENRTASKVASSLHMQVSAARKHLEQLASLGLASEGFHRGSVGRPKKFYALTEKGREMFPRHYDTILNQVMAKLVEQEGPEYAESLMRGIATDVAKTLDGEDLSSSEHVKRVQAGVNHLGFEATLDKNAGGLTVISRNCPVWKAALVHGEVVCRGFHGELLKTALGGQSVDRQEWMVDGDSYCKHQVSKRPAKETRKE